MQIVPKQFNDFAKGDVRPHSFGCRISFDKEWDDDTSMFTLNQSMLNSGDLLGTGEDNVLQAWDFYDYKDYTDRITYMEWERSLEFPYSVATARADFGLANTDGYFDPGVIRKLLARNQSTNPSFETGSGTVEVRRNLIPNPRMTGDNNGRATRFSTYNPSNQTSIASKVGAETQRFHQTSYTGTGSAGAILFCPVSATGTDTYTAQIDVSELSLVNGTVRLIVEEYTSSWVKSHAKVIEAVGVTSLTFTKGSSSTELRVGVQMVPTSSSVDTYVDFSRLMLEKIGVNLPYFDGSYNQWQSPDLTPSWTGAANNSASVLTGVAPAGYDTSGTAPPAWLSTQGANHGSKFVRSMIKTPGAVAMNIRDTDGVSNEDVSGMMMVRSSVATSPTARWLSKVGFTPETIGTVSLPADTWTEVKDTRSVGITNPGLSLIWSSAEPPVGSFIDFDKHYVVKGGYDGGYFDGDTADSGNINYVWDGTPNASTSSEIRVLGSPIGDYILPKRPVRLLSGFKNTLIPQFVGLTQGLPESSEREKIAEFTALDFLTQIYDMPIRKTIAMANVRTDEVLANIFQQFGLSPSQYSLEKGRNVIPFLFFEKEQTLAGDVIRSLMEAEMGMLWLSEDGVIRFRARIQVNTDPVYELNGSEIVDLSVASDDEIINTVNFTGEVRVLADWQSVFTKTETETAHVVRANSTFVFEAGLKDPCLEIQQPVRGELEGVSWFVPRNSGGAIVSNVVVQSVELRTNSYDITFKNNNSFDVNISEMELYGQPGKVAYSVDYPMSYQPSVEKFETKEININNNFIQTEDQMRSLGLMILNDYAEYASIINCEIKGNPALQLGDIISIDYKQYTGNYRIINMTNSLRDAKFTQIVKLRQVEHVDWFILNSSTLNGTDILAP